MFEQIIVSTSGERLNELNGLIYAGIIARRHAETDEQRQEIQRILESAYNAKYEILERISKKAQEKKGGD